MTHEFGIIGAGIMGGAVGRVLKNIPSVKIRAICDPDIERREALGQELGVAALYANHKDMLDKEKLDAVAVATPDHFHRRPVVDALQAGCHVYVEKPMATSQADAEEMFRVVKTTGKKLQVDFNHRWLSPYHKVREMITAGKIGEPLIGFARKNNPIFGTDPDDQVLVGQVHPGLVPVLPRHRPDDLVVRRRSGRGLCPRDQEGPGRDGLRYLRRHPVAGDL